MEIFARGKTIFLWWQWTERPRAALSNDESSLRLVAFTVQRMDKRYERSVGRCVVGPVSRSSIAAHCRAFHDEL